MRIGTGRALDLHVAAADLNVVPASSNREIETGESDVEAGLRARLVSSNVSSNVSNSVSSNDIVWMKGDYITSARTNRSDAKCLGVNKTFMYKESPHFDS